MYMKKAFIAMTSGPDEKDWKEVYRFSHSTFKTYAKKHGYTFLPLWYNDLDMKRWPDLLVGRTHPYWLKIPAINETLEKYDVVLFMDSDCLILDDSVDIASTVQRAIALAVVDGWGGPVVSTAVSVTHRNGASEKFWREAWTCDAYLRNTGWADNANVAYLLGWSINAPWHKDHPSEYEPHFHDLGVEWNAYTANGGEYVRGCRVYHASGSGDPRTKLAWMRNALEQRARE
jgi:hypothetical protein